MDQRQLLFSRNHQATRILKMKWFKHISTSLDDPFIFDLITHCGSDGYMTFFGVIEIYAREFKPDPGWKLCVTIDYLKQKFQKRQATTIIKSLSFIGTHGKLPGNSRQTPGKLPVNSSQTPWELVINSKKVMKNSGKWDVEIDGNQVIVFIPKFTELMDEWAQRKLGSRSGVTPKILIHDIEEEEDIDKEKEYVCSEVQKTPEPTRLQTEIPILEIPLIPKHGAYQIFQKDIDEWEKDFPGVNVHQSLRNLRQWNLSSPTRRKTKSGIRKHITSWLARDQDRSHGSTGKSLMQNNINAAVEAERILFGNGPA